MGKLELNVLKIYVKNLRREIKIRAKDLNCSNITSFRTPWKYLKYDNFRTCLQINLNLDFFKWFGNNTQMQTVCNWYVGKETQQANGQTDEKQI